MATKMKITIMELASSSEKNSDQLSKESTNVLHLQQYKRRRERTIINYTQLERPSAKMSLLYIANVGRKALLLQLKVSRS